MHPFRRKSGWVFLFLLGFTLSSFAQQALPSWDSRSRDAWWARNPTPAQWPQAATDLQAQLEAAYKKDGSYCYANSDFQAWLDHLEWIRLGIDCPALLNDPAHLQAFVALGKDETVSHLFVGKLSPRDNRKQALKILLQLEQAGADDLHDYAALGVAYSLVFDQPFPRNWPHRQVAQSAVPIGDVDPVKRFAFYVDADKNQKAELDLKQLSFENLKYLVDSEVTLDELTYAQKNRISSSHFADAYFSIVYDRSRYNADRQVYNWPFDRYTLADIEKNGGICIDQAYYAETLGKGRGIPTIRFDGLGVDAAHAWFGYLGHSGKWELDCGRYEDQSFPKGFAVDPQTWQPIDDATLTNLFKTGSALNSNYEPEMTALAWAELHVNGPLYRQILEEARKVMPEWVATWRLESAVLEKDDADPAAAKAFYQDWITQFQAYPDLKVEGQRRLLAVLKKANDPEADSLQQSIVLENRSGGFDLGIQSSAEILQEKLKAQDWDAARHEFEKSIRDYGEQGGFTLIDQIITPYVETCLRNNRADQADAALHFMQDRMTIDPTSQVGLYVAKLQEQVALQKKAQAGG